MRVFLGQQSGMFCYHAGNQDSDGMATHVKNVRVLGWLQTTLTYQHILVHAETPRGHKVFLNFERRHSKRILIGRPELFHVDFLQARVEEMWQCQQCQRVIREESNDSELTNTVRVRRLNTDGHSQLWQATHIIKKSAFSGIVSSEEGKRESEETTKVAGPIKGTRDSLLTVFGAKVQTLARARSCLHRGGDGGWLSAVCLRPLRSAHEKRMARCSCPGLCQLNVACEELQCTDCCDRGAQSRRPTRATQRKLRGGGAQGRHNLDFLDAESELFSKHVIASHKVLHAVEVGHGHTAARPPLVTTPPVLVVVCVRKSAAIKSIPA